MPVEAPVGIRLRTAAETGTGGGASPKNPAGTDRQGSLSRFCPGVLSHGGSSLQDADRSDKMNSGVFLAVLIRFAVTFAVGLMSIWLSLGRMAA